jgi:hypothetical protein
MIIKRTPEIEPDGAEEGRVDFHPFDTPYPNAALVPYYTPLTSLLDAAESCLTTAEREEMIFETRVELIARLDNSKPCQYVRAHLQELVTLTMALQNECPGFFTFHAAIAEILILSRYDDEIKDAHRAESRDYV